MQIDEKPVGRWRFSFGLGRGTILTMFLSTLAAGMLIFFELRADHVVYAAGSSKELESIATSLKEISKKMDRLIRAVDD